MKYNVTTTGTRENTALAWCSHYNHLVYSIETGSSKESMYLHFTDNEGNIVASTDSSLNKPGIPQYWIANIFVKSVIRITSVMLEQFNSGLKVENNMVTILN